MNQWLTKETNTNESLQVVEEKYIRTAWVATFKRDTEFHLKTLDHMQKATSSKVVKKKKKNTYIAIKLKETWHLQHKQSTFICAEVINVVINAEGPFLLDSAPSPE